MSSSRIPPLNGGIHLSSLSDFPGPPHGETLVAELDAKRDPHLKEVLDNSLLWRDVGADSVTAFLDQYEEHSAATKVQTKLLKEYIEKEVGQRRLVKWTVLVSGGSKEKIAIGQNGVRLVDRAWHLTASTEPDRVAEKKYLVANGQYRIRRLVNPPDEKIDLGKTQIDAALQLTVDDWQRDPKGRKNRPTAPAGRFLRRQRDPGRGLLILYPLDPGEQKSEKGDKPILGFAISFPSVADGSASKVTYKVNNVYQQQERM